MGRVWRAADEILGREVAVKEMRIDGLDPEDTRTRRQRTLREARATARIDHPNVVRIYDVVDAGERLWIVMELVDGRSLERIIAESGPLDVREAARIGLELVAALVQVHAGGVLHRDIKPANVLVERGGHHRVVLTDFGIAAIQDAEALTMAGMLVGSPDYMAPERVSGRPQGPPSDLWSLGATLCAALGGHSPFSRATTYATLHAVLYEEPDIPSGAGELSELLAALLDKEPGARPGMDEVAGALGPVAAGWDAREGDAGDTGDAGDAREVREAGGVSVGDGASGGAASLASTGPARPVPLAPPVPPVPPAPVPGEEVPEDPPRTPTLRNPPAPERTAPGPPPPGSARPVAESGQHTAVPEPDRSTTPVLKRPGTPATGRTTPPATQRPAGPEPPPPPPLPLPLPIPVPGNASSEAPSEGTPELPSEGARPGPGPWAIGVQVERPEPTAPATGTGPETGPETETETGTEIRTGAEESRAPARSRPAPTPPGELLGPAVPAHPTRTRWSKRRIGIAAALGVAAAGAVAALVIPAIGGPPDGKGTSSGPASASASASPSAVTSGPTGDHDPGTSSSPPPTVAGTSRPPSIPAEAEREAGLYAWVPPQGWQRVAESGAEVHYTSPDRTQEILANASPAQGDLLRQWREKEEQDTSKGLDYRRIRLEETTFRGSPAVVWEYTVTARGLPWHVRLLGFRSGGTSYEISTWYAPDIEDRALPVYERVRDGFTPL
ncbi:protein kinase [Streptomyces sp. NPDC046862]|uniref:protein kinase domain-containing protein n=1 Tax=Streptomyces sp. NPDC046862 TaxID=3154603 RepID=UPI003451E6EF